MFVTPTLRFAIGRDPRYAIGRALRALAPAQSIAALALVLAPGCASHDASSTGPGARDAGQSSSSPSDGDTRAGAPTTSDSSTADSSAAAARDARDLTPEFEVADGLAVRLWAESPDLYNPTAIDVDARGRVWVTEAVNYRQYDGRNPGLHHDAGDRVVILEDTDGDGACDSSKVFVQEKDLVSPLGIAVIGSKIVVSCSPSIFVYTDENGDDVPDSREVFLTGFGGENHDHGVHSVVVGPDGGWYVAVGNAGPHLVTDKAGFKLRSGSLYTGGGMTESDNHPGLLSSDGRVWTGGLVLRVGEDGKGLAVAAHNFRNEYEVALDSFGEMYTSDNDDDGNASCRTTWVMEGGNYGYFSADGARYWTADRRPGQAVERAHWHQDDPGVMPAGTINGAGGPTGVVVYEGELLGAELDGAVLNADAGRNCVYAHRPVAKGAGYELERGVFLASRAGSDGESARSVARSGGGDAARTGGGDDARSGPEHARASDAVAPSALPAHAPESERAQWFRPSDVAVGTDGAVYVADWYDRGVGGHLMSDREGYGRILRIAPKGAPVENPKIDLSTPQGAIAALENPAVHVRALGARALVAGGAASIPALRDEWTSQNLVHRVRALWVLVAMSDLAPPKLQLARMLEDREPRIRAAVLRAMRRGFASPENIGRAMRTQSDPSLAVRRELCLSIDWLMPRAPTAVGLARGYIAGDRVLLEALGLGCEARWRSGGDELRKRDVAELMSWIGKDPLRWSDANAEIVWRLHPPELIPALVKRANAPSLSHDARMRALDTLAFMPDEKAASAVLDLALGGPEDLREMAVFWIEQRDTNDWREYHVAEELGPRGHDRGERVYRSGVLESGSVEVDVDITDAKRMWLVVNDGRRDNAFDWADWIEPRVATASGEIALVDVAWVAASAGWGDVHVGRNVEGGPLAIGGRTFTRGIGTHADSEIEYELPPGCTRFRATVGVDDGGSKQPGSTSDVEFELYVERDRGPSRDLARALTDTASPNDAVESAAKELASDARGGLLLVQLAAAKRLTPKAKEAVARYIFDNPDLSVRALASESFARPKPSEAASRSMSVEALKGDPARGAVLFFGDAARCSTCHTYYGKGGDVGPNLSELKHAATAGEILDSILHPSDAIAFGFDTWLFETEDGTLITGFLLSDGEKIVIKDTAGRRHVLEKADVASRVKQRVSTMPDDTALGLKDQDLADVVALLVSDPKAPGKRLAEQSLFDGASLAGWKYVSEEPASRVEDVWTAKDGVLSCAGKPTGYLRTEADYTSFVLTLEWRFDPERGPGNSGVLMRVQPPDKVWPKSIEAQLHHLEAGDIWNIDSFPMQTDEARTRGRHTAKLVPTNEKPIGEWNKYVITLDGGELVLEVNGEVQNKASWCEERAGKIALQSEGAAIQFRNIRLTPIER